MMKVHWKRPEGIVPFQDGSVAKHYGPGPHPGTGSSQAEAHDPGHGSSRVHTTRGFGTLKPFGPIEKRLTHPDGTEFKVSFTDLEGPLQYVEPTGKIKKVSAAKVAEVRQKILNTAEQFGIDPTLVDANLDRILESALARYKENPQLELDDMFYKGWHEAIFVIHSETDIEFSRIIAGGASMSPGLDAPANLHFTNDIATWVSEDLTWEGDEVDEIINELDIAADAILNPVYMEQHEEVKAGKKNIGDPRPKPKPGSARHTQGLLIQTEADRYRGQDSLALSELSGSSGAYALHYYRSQVGGLPIDFAPPVLTGEIPGGGFRTSKGYENYGNAIAVMRGYDFDVEGNRYDVNSSDVLGDIKVRSFHNNILDPDNLLGFDDVTVDFHTVNAAHFVVGADKNTTLNGTPALEGVGLGIRPLAADGIRRQAAKANLAPLRIQEIVWAEWKRGLTEARNLPDDVAKPDWWIERGDNQGGGPRAITHWRSFDGTYYELPNVEK